MKYIFIFVGLFSNCLLDTKKTYRPMTMKTINFGGDVCYYQDISDNSKLVYVKPCEEGKTCKDLGISDYDIHTCQGYDEEYHNEGETCVSKDYISGIDCTGNICNTDGKCGTSSVCTESQVYDSINDKCVSDPGYCYEYETDLINFKNKFTAFGNKECAQIELKATNTNKDYGIIKVYSNYIASIDDGQYIMDDKELYCQSGYALYFFGGEQLKNPNDNPTNEKMFLRCVTVLGRDIKGIIKYKIGNGEEKFYDPSKLSNNPENSQKYKVKFEDDDYLMLRLEMFKNYKNRLDSISNCRETNCEDNELSKWIYFYEHPEQYILYKDEPQVIGYLIQKEGLKYSPNGANTLGNINYLIVLLLLLFI